MIRFTMRRFIYVLCATGLLGASSQALASAFQLWEQDAATIGNVHAGYAAGAFDASTSFYNPAGLTRFKNQQIVVGTDAVMSDFKYQGIINVNALPTEGNQTVTAQGGNFALIPFLHYAAPISDCLSFGFSTDIPFGLQTNYGQKTVLRYAATQTSIMVVDISPSFAYQVTSKASIGAGLDVQRANAQFNSVGTLITPTLDTTSTNTASDTGYGGHFGILYQFSDDSRVGLSYHTQVVHHMSGSSQFTGPIANLAAGGPFSSRATTNITLPAYTAFGVYDKVFPKVGLMANVIYTQWSILRALIMNNLSALSGFEPSTTVQVVTPQYYRNTWNISVGADYYATDAITLRAGVGYDQSPVRNAYRDVRLPDNNRVAFAVGGHYQASSAVGLDLGYQHLFISNASIHPPAQVAGDQIVTTNGSVRGGADVFGGEVVWDIA